MMILDYSINEHNGSIGEDLEASAFQVQARWLPESKHPSNMVVQRSSRRMRGTDSDENYKNKTYN